MVSRLLCFLLLLASASAGELTVIVLDPDGAPVAGARIVMLRGDVAVAIRTTTSSGEARFPDSAAGDHIQVLAPGFATFTRALNASEGAIEARLSVAVPTETVTVTATQLAIPTEESGRSVATLDGKQIELMNPVSAADAVRFMPGAVVNAAGRRGSLSSLFVRGGESRYNKVIVDGVPINEPGGTFDFGVVPTQQVDRIEFFRGAESTLYGSDAMTSVVQFFSATGSTLAPELRFGADGGNFGSAHGYASLAGAWRRFDYNLFADQFNTAGQGVNDEYGNSSQGANLGVVISPRAHFRFRTRHSNSRTGVQSFWNFNGQPLLPPDTAQYARQNNFLASAQLTLLAGQFEHRFTGYEYNHRRLNEDLVSDRGCAPPLFLDCGFSDLAHINRAGLDYGGQWSPTAWAQTAFGYRYDNENGFINQDFSGFLINSHGLRRSHEVFAQQIVHSEHGSLTGGLRYVNNESYGSRVIPRIAGSLALWRGNSVLSGTRLKAAYGEGIKEPRLEETFGAVGAFGPVIVPNPDLLPEENRSYEAGVQQSLFGGRYAFTATYFHNQFKNQIAFSFDPLTFTSRYVNLNRALAHGAELEFHARPSHRLSFDATYVHTSSQILEAPTAFDPLLAEGAPLLRRPKHSGNMLLTYVRSRWGATFGGTFLGRRTDSDFLGLTPPVTYAAGYARFDTGGWFALNRFTTAYINVENLLDRDYEEAAGYPALGVNFRAGLRFRLGGK